MKKSQTSDKESYFKKINRFHKNLSSIKLSNNPNILKYPLIVKGKNIKYQNSKENLSILSNKTHRYKNNILFSTPRTKEETIQTISSQEGEKKIIKKSPKDLLIKNVSKFLFSKKVLKVKLNTKSENKNNFSNYSNNTNSFNLVKYKQIPNIKFSLYNEKPNLVSVAQTTRNFIANNYTTNINAFKYKLFKYDLIKQKRKIDKFLYNIKKSQMIEMREINQKLLRFKVKPYNSKSTTNDLKN